MQDSHVNVPGSCTSHNTNSASKLCHARLSELIRLDYLLPGSGSPVSRHFITQAIDGIEQQKAEDITVLETLS
ncbi:hypothetical protein QFZ89_002824 [Paraburkholderia youngii]